MALQEAGRSPVGVIVLLGPPGVGKGTQATLLADRCGARHVSTGGLLRSEVASGSALGNEIGAMMARGDLVPDDRLFACLGRELVRPSPSSGGGLLLLDGVPRNLAQVGVLDEALSGAGAKVDLVLALEAPVELLVARFERRWSCSRCGGVFALTSVPAAGSACGRCGSVDALVRRSDDEPDAVRRRLAVYAEATAPVASAYQSRGLLEVIDGLQEPEAVHMAVRRKIAKIFPHSGC